MSNRSRTWPSNGSANGIVRLSPRMRKRNWHGAKPCNWTKRGCCGVFASAGPDREVRALFTFATETLNLLVRADEEAAGLAELTGDSRFVYDSYRRLVQMFATVVLDLPDEPFETALARLRRDRGVGNDADNKECKQGFNAHALLQS